ncbi:MAG: peptidoglycan-binding protein [Candidatus Accumulibacter sp.]|nr:peptidoglycan-binding protein [Accumulibacter sp.]
MTEGKQKEGMGFAGIASLVSDANAAIPFVEEKNEEIRSEATPKTKAPVEQQPQVKPQPTQAPSPSSSGSSAGLWVIIAVVIGVVWAIGASNQSSSPAPAHSSPSYGPSTTTPSYSAPPTQASIPSRPTEEKPPIGRNLTLSVAQIQYCVAEDIRIGGARSAVDNYNSFHVDRFNAMVADYNSRCSEFRYRRGALESARRNMESYRGQLQAEGRNRLLQNPTSQIHSEPDRINPSIQPARPAYTEIVREIQFRLNELGYDAGSADGVAGNRTRSAILAFQRDERLAATGVADDNLLSYLERSARQAESMRVLNNRRR